MKYLTSTAAKIIPTQTSINNTLKYRAELQKTLNEFRSKTKAFDEKRNEAARRREARMKELLQKRKEKEEEDLMDYKKNGPKLDGKSELRKKRTSKHEDVRRLVAKRNYSIVHLTRAAQRRAYLAIICEKNDGKIFIRESDLDEAIEEALTNPVDFNQSPGAIVEEHKRTRNIISKKKSQMLNTLKTKFEEEWKKDDAEILSWFHMLKKKSFEEMFPFDIEENATGHGKSFRSANEQKRDKDV